MIDAPILYSFRRCPYAMRARMAIIASGHSVKLREVVLRNKPEDMLAVSPKGTVPVLCLLDGRVLDESLEIIHWVLGNNDPEGWLSGDDPSLIAHNDGPFKAALDRYKYPNRYGLNDGLEHRQEGAIFLNDLNAMLSKHIYLKGAAIGLTDIAIFPFIRQFAATDPAWFDAQAWPNLQNWLYELSATPLFELAMQKFPQWHSGDPDSYFP